MALEGYAVTINVGASSNPTDEIPGINDFSISDGRTELNVTTFEGNAGAMQRLLGLRDPSITLSGFFDSSTEQQLLRSSYTSGADVYILIELDGSGAPSIEYVVKVASFDVSVGVDGTNDVTYNLVCNGAPTITES
jgi:hypothetical protein